MLETITARRCRPHFHDGTVTFRVWAPKAKSVKLIWEHQGKLTSPTMIEMAPEDDGYFSLLVENLKQGDRYAYSLDDGPARPDPCSVWQVDGVHKPSALYDASAFAWTDKDWVGIPRKQLSFYELHVATFTPEGTFDAAIARLPDLVELGITAVEVMPVAQYPGERNWGYDGVHLFATQNTYGGPAAFQRFVDAAHKAGLAVFLDVVLNHFGPEGNYVSNFGPYYSHRYSTPWGPAFNFDDHYSDPVRRFTLESIAHWIGDFHLDGLRLDAVHAMFDISPRHILADIKVIADEVAAQQGRSAMIIAESLMNDVRMVRPPAVGGYGLDAEWNEDFHHAWLAFMIGETHGKYVDFGNVSSLPRIIEKTFCLSNRYSRFRGRTWGAEAAGISGDHFVIGVQNHDHAGNRAFGERTGQLLSHSLQRLSAAFMLVSPYLPLIFMGEEYGEDRPFLFFCSFEDKQLIENVRVGRRRDYDLEGDIPDPQAVESFERSKLSWSWPEGSFQARLRMLYRDLLAARKNWPSLQDFENRTARLWPEGEAPSLLYITRGLAPNRIAAILNLTDKPVSLEKSYPTAKLKLRTESEPYANITLEHEGAEQIETIMAYECLIFDD